MYSKEDAIKIKRDFWTKFAEIHPRKWLLYQTKIKDFSFKFFADNKIATVSLEIECKDDEMRKIYFQKIESLQSILKEKYINDVIFDEYHTLSTGKIISKIWVEIDGVCINNPKTWDTIFDFYNEKMDAFERFFYEYEDYIRDLELNT